MKPYKPAVCSALSAIATWDITEYRQAASNGLTLDAAGRPARLHWKGQRFFSS